MPYIDPVKRPLFRDTAIELGQKAECAGDLNYIFTEIIHSYLRKVGTNYNNYNSVIGLLECCKLELYRRQVALYENLKITQNGDVPDISEQPNDQEISDVDH